MHRPERKRTAVVRLPCSITQRPLQKLPASHVPLHPKKLAWMLRMAKGTPLEKDLLT